MLLKQRETFGGQTGGGIQGRGIQGAGIQGGMGQGGCAASIRLWCSRCFLSFCTASSSCCMFRTSVSIPASCFSYKCKLLVCFYKKKTLKPIGLLSRSIPADVSRHLPDTSPFLFRKASSSWRSVDSYRCCPLL